MVWHYIYFFDMIKVILKLFNLSLTRGNFATEGNLAHIPVHVIMT